MCAFISLSVKTTTPDVPLTIGISRFAKTAEALELLLKGKINEEEFEALLRKGIEEAYDEDHAKRREKIIQNQEEKALEQEV